MDIGLLSIFLLDIFSFIYANVDKTNTNKNSPHLRAVMG